MAVRYLDGARLRRSAAAAARWVSQRQENLNGINVFPVADGDTGTNLAATLVSAAESARRVRSRNIGRVARALADGALFGACGNSGAIMAQFLEGFADSLSGDERATGPDLAAAAQQASSSARAALAKPREGTILTVMNAWAERFGVGATNGADLLEIFRDSISEANEALARTPQQLRELAKAGVVDAGAQGFVYFLEGMLHFAEGRLAGAVIEDADQVVALEHASVAHDATAIEYRYCTECLVEGKALDIASVRETVEPFGDSVVVAGSPRRVRVHVHTDQPEEVFAAIGTFGSLVSTKADDMRSQHTERFERDRVAIVTDSAADIPPRLQQQLRIHAVPLRVFLGTEAYLDKQTLTPDEVYERLVRGEQRVGTSQPPPGDYITLYQYLFEHYSSIVVVSLSGALSGTLEAAQRAANSVDSARIEIFDTRTASIAEGLIVCAAAERAAQGGEVDDILDAALDARHRIKLILGAPSVEYLERGGRVRGWKTRLARRLNLVPILTVAMDRGTVKLHGIARRGRVHRTILDGARKGLGKEQSAPKQIWIAHAGAPDVADAYRSALAEVSPESTIDIMEAGPVIGAHTGPGAVAIAWLSRDNR